MARELPGPFDRIICAHEWSENPWDTASDVDLADRCEKRAAKQAVWRVPEARGAARQGSDSPPPARDEKIHCTTGRVVDLFCEKDCSSTCPVPVIFRVAWCTGSLAALAAKARWELLGCVFKKHRAIYTIG